MSEPAASPEATTEPEPPTRIKGPVFYGAATGVVAIALWAVVSPAAAGDTIGTLVGWTSEWFGWFYILFATAVLVFVLFLGVSRYGTTKLGPEHSTPEYSTFAWAAMLFAAGIGTDLMFFAVAEPVTQYLAPPVGEGETVAAAREATVWTLFHYGITGWGMYALMGMALAYAAYRRNLPLAIRSALYPVFGKRIHGALGHGVDLAAILGTIFGVATSLGIGVVQLNFGLSVLFGIPEGRAAQIGLIVLAVGAATVSAVSGIDRGIKRLSQLNVLLAIGLALFVLVAGRTTFLLDALVLNIGDFVSTFPSLTMQTFAFDRPVEWLNGWTLFFWAWWTAWAAFVGLFLARISRGRTIRQFVAGTMLIPFSYIVMWISIFGNSAIDRVRSGDAAFGQLAANTPEQGFYTLLMDYPAFPFIGAVATFIGLLFYVTSADSGALVMANLSSHLARPKDDAGPGLRIFWAVATGLLTAAMLVVGGVPALQNATIIMGLPFAFVMVLVMVGLHRALRLESLLGPGRLQALPGLSNRVLGAPAAGRRPSGRRVRRGRAMAFAGENSAEEYLEEVAVPALREVAGELRGQGIGAQVRRSDGAPDESSVELTADLGGEHPFHYRLRLRALPVLGHGSRARAHGDTYPRLQVQVGEGALSHDVLGYTHSQLIDDVLHQYGRHLELLGLQESIPASRRPSAERRTRD
ncbi:choline/glycine/proline betaine transport protein [Geodermatophilus pulveris]|uniref:Choline/glycine/proline betaine transport protein n=1 Tax=Geodermatophilus pulveris TaxID=1564159 RepID=A0A239C9J4_9ACTN|nr:choline BCCT transporter BetT [Geodermatophilus pulveris]SNS16629.1 choline/glycine/proline betaine transport protein [Geodermatophilus pulveris]